MAIWKQNPYLLSFIALFLVVPLLVFAVATPIRAGVKTQCKYNHLIKDGTYNTIVWRIGADEHKAATVTSLCDRHQKLEALLWQAKSAKKVGDTERSKRLVAEIKKIDPTFRSVELAALIGEPASGGAQPGTSTGTSPGTTPGGTNTPPGETPVFSGELTAMFPKSLDGYTMINDSPGSLSASRMYKADETHPKVDTMTIQVSLTGTIASGEAYIKQNVKGYYAASGKAVPVNGANGYFGTDGDSLAVLAYPVDSVLVELEMSALNVSAVDLYDELIELSKQVR